MATKKAPKAAATEGSVAEGKGSAVVVTVQQAGNTTTRTFNAESHGADWRKTAASFIETCKLEDGEGNRAKYISHSEVE